MNCPSIKDEINPSLCIIIPSFKRDYFSLSFPSFSNQTYKSKLYVIIQNDNKIHYNISHIQHMVNEPGYHRWMQNWNSLFYLNHRISSLFPCDFILKYDDDQWPEDALIHEKLIENAKNKNVIIGERGFLINESFCGYSPKSMKKIKNNTVEHSAVPLLIRPGYLKLDARNKIYKLYGAEDVALSLNSWKLCNVTSQFMEMKLTQKQFDGKNHRGDELFLSLYKNEIDVFMNTYCYLIRSGYIPQKWTDVTIPKNDYINITIEHKNLKD